MSAPGRLRLLDIAIAVLAVEKALQHALTALFFVVDVFGRGPPDIGPYHAVPPQLMAAANVVYAAAFAVALVYFVRRASWSAALLGGLALLDIVLEFVFHGTGFITVSVLVSVVMIVLLLLRRRRSL